MIVEAGFNACLFCSKHICLLHLSNCQGSNELLSPDDVCGVPGREADEGLEQKGDGRQEAVGANVKSNEEMYVEVIDVDVVEVVLDVVIATTNTTVAVIVYIELVISGKKANRSKLLPNFRTL